MGFWPEPGALRAGREQRALGFSNGGAHAVCRGARWVIDLDHQPELARFPRAGSATETRRRRGGSGRAIPRARRAKLLLVRLCGRLNGDSTRAKSEGHHGSAHRGRAPQFWRARGAKGGSGRGRGLTPGVPRRARGDGPPQDRPHGSARLFPAIPRARGAKDYCLVQEPNQGSHSAREGRRGHGVNRSVCRPVSRPRLPGTRGVTVACAVLDLLIAAASLRGARHAGAGGGARQPLAGAADRGKMAP